MLTKMSKRLVTQEVVTIDNFLESALSTSGLTIMVSNGVTTNLVFIEKVSTLVCDTETDIGT